MYVAVCITFIMRPYSSFQDLCCVEVNQVSSASENVESTAAWPQDEGFEVTMIAAAPNRAIAPPSQTGRAGTGYGSDNSQFGAEG